MNTMDRLRCALADAGYNFTALGASMGQDAPWEAWKLALELTDVLTEPFFVVAPQADNQHTVNVSVRGRINGNCGDFHICLHVDLVMMEIQNTTRMLVAAWKAAIGATG